MLTSLVGNTTRLVAILASLASALRRLVSNLTNLYSLR